MPARKVSWNLVLDEMIRAWDAEGVGLAEQFERLRSVVPEGATMAAFYARRRRLGLARPHADSPWKGRPTEILLQRYGPWSAESVARAIAKETGFQPSPHAVRVMAHELGVSAMDSRGWVCLSDAAEVLGLTPRGVRYALSRLGVRPRGRSHLRYLDERMLAAVQAAYPPLAETWLTDEEAAEVLKMEPNDVRKLCRTGRLTGRRWGARDWRIPRRAIAQFRAPSGWVDPDPVAIHHAHLVGTYVTAARPLYVLSRPDGSILVPSPCPERVTYRKGQIVGKVTGFVAGQAVIDTRFAKLPCDLELLKPEAHPEPVARF